MKKRNVALGIAVLFLLALAGCDGVMDEVVTKAERFFSGTYNGMKFIVEKIVPANKSMGSSVTKLQGKLEDNDGKIYGLTGFYDGTNGKLFTLSGGSADMGFQINGSLYEKLESETGTGYIRKKISGVGGKAAADTGTWEESFDDIDFDDDVEIVGKVNTSAAVSLPTKWHGKWDYSKEKNGIASEEWLSTWGEPGEFCMVITPYGIRTWVDLLAKEKEIDNWIQNGMTGNTQQEKDKYREETLAIYLYMSYEINTLEVEKISNNEYHVLVSCIRPENYGGSGDTEYRKIRFMQVGAGLNATLAYIDDPKASRPWNSEDINKARAAKTFKDDPFDGGEGTNWATLYMTKF